MINREDAFCSTCGDGITLQFRNEKEKQELLKKPMCVYCSAKEEKEKSSFLKVIESLKNKTGFYFVTNCGMYTAELDTYGDIKLSFAGNKVSNLPMYGWIEKSAKRFWELEENKIYIMNHSKYQVKNGKLVRHGVIDEEEVAFIITYKEILQADFREVSK